jgi:hypothetical protein
MKAEHTMPNTLEELRSLERDVECEWWWLHGAINAVAQARTEHAHGDARSFREMQAQAREVDRRRVQIALRIAELASGLNECDRSQ